MFKCDTIVAIATALSNAGIGIIRISGEDAFVVANKIFRSKSNKQTLLDYKTHTIHYGFIYDDEELIDEVMISIMKSPNSFTTENTVEINCHGGILIMNKILTIVLKNGTRIAEPGEFTKRAFLNGRIDLSKAEAIMDLIHAKNELSLKSSMKQLSGAILQKVKELRRQIIYEIAFIESALDDPEHISLDGYEERLGIVVNGIIVELQYLCDSTENGKYIQEGIKTVILGKPNVGKSSFLNAMIGVEKAIVTNIPGTTRDFIEEHIMLDGISLQLIDTAGIRDANDEVEKIGILKSKEQGLNADLIIYIIDTSESLSDSDYEIMRFIKDKKYIILLNKCDLSSVITKEMISNEFYNTIGNNFINMEHMFEISIKNNLGIEQVKQCIKGLFFNNDILTNDEIVITNIRHKELIMDALNSMNQVNNSLNMQMPEDFLSIDLMSAYSSLGFLIGEEVSEDLINEIFSKFCTGK
ncbi:MAG: tRNA uridine-5-carboxymethylaminomethyl(34) synthesis GTPase MnmE [Eubacteriales bacterium]